MEYQIHEIDPPLTTAEGKVLGPRPGRHLSEFTIHSKKHGSQVVLLDDGDFTAMAGFNWFVIRPGTTFYVVRNVRRGVTQYLHTLILGSKWVDHINGNGLDNRRANLRPATAAENVQNRSRYRNNTSGAPGVTWNRNRSKWQVKVGQAYIGTFTEFAEAVQARRAAEVVLQPFNTGRAW